MYPMEAPMKMSKEEKAEHEKYEAESDVRTLRDAAEIKKDSKRLARAKAMIKEQMAALKDVSD